MRFLERGQTNEERYQYFLEREGDRRKGQFLGGLRTYLAANFLTAWARITEEQIGVPVEPGQVVVSRREVNSSHEFQDGEQSPSSR